MDIGTVSAIAGLLGLSLKDLQPKLEGRRNTKKVQQRRKDAQAFANPKKIIELLSAFYRNNQQSGNNLRRYCLRVGERQVETTIYTTPQNLAINTPPLEIPMDLVPQESPEATLPKILSQQKNYVPKVLNRIEQMGIKIWNAPTYRLLDFRQSDAPHFRFTETDYYSGRFTTGLVYDETVDALVSCKGNVDLLLTTPSKYMPIRTALFPTPASFFAFQNRICIGGPGVVFALARPAPHNDFLIPLQVRSHQVSTEGGEYAVLPQGCHQPIAGQKEEVNIHWTVFREIYEELFGGEEVQDNSGRLRYDWYYEQCQGIGYFYNHEGAYEIELVSCGISSLSGFYDLSVLVAVFDTWYWKTYFSLMKQMWEANSIVQVSTRNPSYLSDILCQGNWDTKGVFHFAQCLSRLKEMQPKRVELPEIEALLID